MTLFRSVIRGVGAYLPEQIVTNDDLARRVDTSDQWIQERTGIKQRHIAAEGQLTSDLGIAAAQHALVRADMDAQEIDLIVVATSTPDRTFPATATTIQAALGINHGAAFDLQAVCSGFVYALSTADNFLRSGQHKRALVIGAETFSRILDWEDRTTCVLFGDGAGAVVLEAQESTGEPDERGVIVSRLRSDGRYNDKLYVDGGPSSTQTVGHLRMHGREVFRHAVTNISSVMQETMDLAGIPVSEVDLIVPHQANKRILDGTARKVGISPEKIVITVDIHGNTSAASIPLALNHAYETDRLKKNDLVLMEAMGGGFTWGAMLARW
ncbi:MAG: beta-ketoacyl-ACP synthase III [Methyloligellaceae bacterium]